MGALIDLFTGIHVGTVGIKVNNYLHLRKHHWNQDLTGPGNINLFFKYLYSDEMFNARSSSN